MEKQKIAVIFGGKSTEHEVSVITGLQVFKNIDTDKYDPIAIYISKSGTWHIGDELKNPDTYKQLETIPSKTSEVILSQNPQKKELSFVNKSESFLSFGKQNPIKIDAIFPCLHGGLGENGGLQGLFELSEIPYIGSGILSSATGMDKIIMKGLFIQNDIPVAKFHSFYRTNWGKNSPDVISDIESKLNYPMFVKPANSGSSIGISKVNNQKELTNGIEVAAAFDRKIIIEEGFEFTKEINVSIIGNSDSDVMTSACEEVYSSNAFLNYDDKYKGNSKSEGMASTKRQIPAEISKKLENEIKETAIKTFKCLDCSGLARIDFLVDDEKGKFIVVEINTLPGSISFYLWEKSNLKFKELTTKLIELAFEKFQDNKNTIVNFSSNILENFGSGTKGSKSN